ncbi:hypothetical protein VTK73DRAFT_9386 [Phialemonium thermophilum]|uniref:Uncharacterized protein n=1 Tax=Phialemonium thermophilum TaxID=223376 RepID=A0ABR3W2P3_9PEZI
MTSPFSSSVGWPRRCPARVRCHTRPTDGGRWVCPGWSPKHTRGGRGPSITEHKTIAGPGELGDYSPRIGLGGPEHEWTNSKSRRALVLPILRAEVQEASPKGDHECGPETGSFFSHSGKAVWKRLPAPERRGIE